MDEYFCPNCGATLNNQPGFDPDGGTWTCTSCGKLLRMMMSMRVTPLRVLLGTAMTVVNY